MDEINYFEELYRSTHNKILVYIISKCGNTEDIKDIFQETYLEIVKIIKKKGTDYISDPEKFALKIAKRKIYKHYKLSEYIKSLHVHNVDENEIAEPVSLEENIIKKDMIEQVQIFLESKSEITKKVFYLYYGFDMSIKDIAEKLSLTESGVKNHLYRTLNEIKRFFQNRGC